MQISYFPRLLNPQLIPAKGLLKSNGFFVYAKANDFDVDVEFCMLIAYINDNKI
jgi:hypothetical protein